MIGKEKKELRKNANRLRNGMSKAEIILWSKLRMRQISGFKFRRQFPVLDYIADFYCHKLKLIIEVDGEIHSLPEQMDTDKTRDNVLIINGYHVLHFRNHEVETELQTVINKIKSFISEMSSSLNEDHRGLYR